MATDIPGLAAMLESSAGAIGTAVTGGADGEVLRLLHAPRGGASPPKRWKDIPVDEFLEATVNLTFTATEEVRINRLTSGGLPIPMTRAAIAAFIEGVLSGSAPKDAALTALRAAFERVATRADQFVTGTRHPISMDDLRAALDATPKAFKNQDHAAAKATRKAAAAAQLATIRTEVEADGIFDPKFTTPGTGWFVSGAMSTELTELEIRRRFRVARGGRG